MKIEKKYTCLGCGYKNLYAEADYAICVMCGWEDDPDSWHYPSEKSGPNWRSLYKHQKKIIRHGFPYYWKKIREEEGDPGDYEINKDWEPFEADYEHLCEVKKEYRQFIWMFGSYAYKEYEESKKKKKE